MISVGRKLAEVEGSNQRWLEVLSLEEDEGSDQRWREAIRG